MLPTGMAASCGQCIPCRINRRRLWTHRIMLESLKHSSNSFLTLTYDAEHLPSGGTLVPRDVQLWIKRFRKAIAPVALRYFLVGEYGDQSWRPHYHAALFGVGPEYGDLVSSTWQKGHVMLGELTLHSAQYVAGYVVKKLTNKNDVRLAGRHPEFTRMSLRPGIGATAIADIVAQFDNDLGHRYLFENGDVPPSLRHGDKTMPLGRYLRRKIREQMGFVESGGQPEVIASFQQEMRLLREDYLASPSGKTFKEFLVDKDLGKILSIEGKYKIFNQPRSVL